MSISSHFLLTDVSVAFTIIMTMMAGPSSVCLSDVCPLVLYVYLSVTLVTAAKMVGLLQIDIAFSYI